MTASTASQLEPSGLVIPPSPRPMNSLLASAQRIMAAKVNRKRITNQAEWQADAWSMFNLVGEEHFLATTLASRLSQARLYVGRMGDDPTQNPVAVTEGPVAEAFAAFGEGTSRSQSQLLSRMGVNLFMTGECWLAGIPRDLLPEGDDMRRERAARGDTDTATFALPPGLASPPPPEPSLGDEPGGVSLEDLDWRVLSVSELSASHGDELTLRLGPGEDLTCKPEDVYLIRVWRPHPQYWWEADSPTRASLPVLHELVGLTMHISAQVDSRLAGAGLLIVPQSAARAFRIAVGMNPDDSSDPFTESLMEAMLTPIKDRASAAAVVPLVATVPDDAVDAFKHISFATPLDGEARNLRDEAIRRLALGQDAPPELLLGTAGMNHWGSWLIREDVVSTHLEPPLALICDALTTQYLHPVLLEQGMSEEEVREYVVWYDVGHLITRPNRFADAATLYDKGVLSAQTLRDAGGFTEDDAPAEQDVDPAVDLVLTLVQKDPSLLTNPGMGVLLEQFRALLAGEEIPELPKPEPALPPEPAPGDDDAPPADETDEGNRPAMLKDEPADAGPPGLGPPSVVPDLGEPS